MAIFEPSEAVYIADGVTRTFGVPFSVLDESDLYVSANGTPVTFYYENARVTLPSSPGKGVEVRVYRNTEGRYVRHEFKHGAPLTPEYLDENFRQGLYTTQESQTYVEGLVREERRLREEADKALAQHHAADMEELQLRVGFEFVGEYAAGVQLTKYNQIVREGGEFWRASGTTALPYTLTGAGVDEGGALVSVGDANLRQELANPGKGAAMVAYQGGSVADKLDEIVSGAVTEPLVDAKVLAHNHDVNSHPELRARIVSEVTSHVTAEADRAEAASNAAFVNADVFPDIATGQASVSVGEQFQVVSPDGLEIIRYRKDSPSVSPEVARYPSGKMINEFRGSAYHIAQGVMPQSFRQFDSKFVFYSLAENLFDFSPSYIGVKSFTDENGQVVVDIKSGALRFTTRQTIQLNNVSAVEVSFSANALTANNRVRVSMVIMDESYGFIRIASNWSLLADGSMQSYKFNVLDEDRELNRLARFVFTRQSGNDGDMRLELGGLKINPITSSGAAGSAGLSGREFSYIEAYSGSLGASSDVSLTATESTELTLSGNGWALGHKPSKFTIPTPVIKGESSFLSIVMTLDGESDTNGTVFQQLGTNRLDIASNGYGLTHNDGIMTIFRDGKNEVFSAYKKKPMIVSALYDYSGAYFFLNDSLVSFASGLSAPTGTSSGFMGGVTAVRDLTQRLHEVRFINGDCNSETLKGQLAQLKSKYSISDSSGLFCGLGATVNVGAQYVALDDNGNVIAKGGKQRKDSPASMTKVMTLLLSLKYLKQDDEIVIAQEDIVQDSLLAAGDTITVKDAQFAAMLVSSNTSANALCRAVGNAIDGGGKSSGVAEMNLTALSLGCSDTNFVNGSGMYNSAQMSTARDQCVIALEASKDTRALRIMSTKSADIKVNGETKQLTSSVKNIGVNGVVSGKTGTISSPSVGVNNVVNIVSKDGMHYAVCVMNATTGDGRFDMVNIVIDGISKSMELMQ